MLAVKTPDGREVGFALSATPVLVLALLILYGLLARPLFLAQAPIPLEVVFLCAASAAFIQLLLMGYPWTAIQGAIVNRLSRAMPGIFILFAIGLIVGSWMVCGTIPMLVYYGVLMIDPSWIYVLAFAVTAIFSTLTGTSWGSAGTIGVVIMGIGVSVGAAAPIVAGAVIGGALFGDKLSPLSDTTNFAAIGAEVPLFEHIRSMLWTTVPSSIAALLVYSTVGAMSQLDGGERSADIEAFLSGLSSLFRYHVLLLLPPAVVLIGSFRRWPTLPVLLASTGTATLLALILQPFATADVYASLTTGFELSMMPGAVVPDTVRQLVERGGLYSMREAIFVAFLVFLFVGAIDLLDTMPRVVGRLFAFARGRIATVLASLGASAVTNAMTSNQSATSFIVGDAFGRRFDALGIPRPVLSRSIEDLGTMIESLIPWHPTALFMVATLGVSVADYWHWQVLSLTNFIVAPVLAITGIGCFYAAAGSASDDEVPLKADEPSARAAGREPAA
ncbi:MAG: Na+/H+ antiporter NhaC family protein [Pseudomonadota bacterium]